MAGFTVHGHFQSRLSKRFALRQRRDCQRAQPPCTDQPSRFSRLYLEALVEHLVQDAVCLCQPVHGVVALAHRADGAAQSVRGGHTSGAQGVGVNLYNAARVVG